MLRIVTRNDANSLILPASKVGKTPAARGTTAGARRSRLDQAMERLGVTINLDRWDVLFREGTPALFVYRVEEGGLRLYDGLGTTVAVIQPSEYCLCNMGDCYSLNSCAVACTEVTRFPRHKFLSFACEDGPAKSALRTAARQQVAAWPSLATVSSAAARLKIVSFLLGLYEELLLELHDTTATSDRIADIVLPRMLGAVAAGLEIKEEAARRELAVLQHQGVIDFRRENSVASLDIAALRQLATGRWGNARTRRPRSHVDAGA